MTGTLSFTVTTKDTAELYKLRQLVHDFLTQQAKVSASHAQPATTSATVSVIASP